MEEVLKLPKKSINYKREICIHFGKARFYFPEDKKTHVGREMYPVLRGREKDYMSRRTRELGEGAKHINDSVLSDLRFCTLSLANIILPLAFANLIR